MTDEMIDSVSPAAPETVSDTVPAAPPAPETKKKKVPVRLILIAVLVLAAAVGGFLAGRALPAAPSSWTNWLVTEETTNNALAEQIERSVYTYGQDGQLLRQEDTLDGKPDGWTEYSYDENGNMTVCATYESNGSLVWRSEYTYDADGNTLSENHMSPEGISTYSYEYDERGNCTLSKYSSSDGETSERRTKITYQSDGGRREEQTYTYSPDGEGFFITRSVWDYDANDNCVHTEEYENDGTLVSATDRVYRPFQQSS